MWYNIDILGRYIEFLQTQELTNVHDQLMPVYFEQIITGIRYEAVLPNVFKHYHREIASNVGYLEDLNPKLTAEAKFAICKAEFERLDDRNHPVRANLFFMDSIPQVKVMIDSDRVKAEKMRRKL